MRWPRQADEYGTNLHPASVGSGAVRRLHAEIRWIVNAFREDTAIYSTEGGLGEVHVGIEGSVSSGFASADVRRLARRGSGLLSDGSIRHKAFRLGSTEPPLVTLLKELQGPVVAVTTLALCLTGYHVLLSLECLAFALIIFLVSNRVLSTPHTQTDPSGQPHIRPTPLRVLLEWSTVSALLAFLATALKFTQLFPNRALLTWFIVTPVALLTSNYGTIHLTRWWNSRRGLHRHIIIGATDIGIELAKRVGQESSPGNFLGFFDYRDRQRLPAVAPEQWAGACNDVADFVQRHAVDAIYIALPISTAPRIAELLRELRDTTASIYFVPNLFAFDLVQPRCMEIHGIPALAVCETPHRGMSGLRKRAIDMVLAVMALLLFGPLMLIVGAAVKWSSPGPVLFRQRRYGLNGEEIFVYKFRTMVVCEDGAIVTQATRDDQRITPLGRFMRRTSLDELPQILNVLEGKMSFVGPRPHAVAHNEQYRKLISGYMIRHKVRPGITGWAQVNGLRGETDTVEKMRERIQYDIDYMNNWSILLDLKILVRTILVVLRGDRAY
jgi:putative colanic acid biosynthesis UDP-glucose lipid carrier transferase